MDSDLLPYFTELSDYSFIKIGCPLYNIIQSSISWLVITSLAHNTVPSIPWPDLHYWFYQITILVIYSNLFNPPIQVEIIVFFRTKVQLQVATIDYIRFRFPLAQNLNIQWLPSRRQLS